jgi:hypothetical protein
MKTNNFVENWKSANMNEIIGTSSISKEMMAEVQGGAGKGYIATVSGDCNSDGTSCIKSAQKIINLISEIFS